MAYRSAGVHADVSTGGRPMWRKTPAWTPTLGNVRARLGSYIEGHDSAPNPMKSLDR